MDAILHTIPSKISDRKLEKSIKRFHRIPVVSGIEFLICVSWSSVWIQVTS